jgi:hypothetical protein
VYLQDAKVLQHLEEDAAVHKMDLASRSKGLFAEITAHKAKKRADNRKLAKEVAKWVDSALSVTGKGSSDSDAVIAQDSDLLDELSTDETPSSFNSSRPTSMTAALVSGTGGSHTDSETKKKKETPCSDPQNDAHSTTSHIESRIHTSK